MRKTQYKPVAEEERQEMLHTFERAEKILGKGMCAAWEIEPTIKTAIDKYTGEYTKTVYNALDLTEKGKECCYYSIREEERTLYRKMWRLLLKYSAGKIR